MIYDIDVVEKGWAMFTDNQIRDKLVRKIGATRIIVLSFVFVIIIGTLLLSLPIAQEADHIPLIDNLFTATSATCVTGLVTLVVKDSYTLFGELVILGLIQIGGLGLMSILAIFITLARQKLAYREKTMLKDALNKIDLDDIGKFLKGIFVYTFIFEGIGFFFLSLQFIPEFGLLEGTYQALFTAISAFCNAGIDVIGSNSLANYVTNPLVNLTISSLIITGGLGFTVWIDIYMNLKEVIKNKLGFRTFHRRLLIHSKVVIGMTVLLLLSGMFMILLFDGGNSAVMGSLNPTDRLLVAFFNSTTLRTAGFSTINYGLLARGTLLVMSIFMFIGGSPGGTAGGIKTTSFFTLVYFIANKFKGKDHLILYRREISHENVNKSIMVIGFSITVVLLGLLLLSFTEPHLDFVALLFEAFSAFGTVGLSTGITMLLSLAGKIVIILLMFIGRVGALAMVVTVVGNAKKRKVSSVEYPHAELLVG